MRYNRITANASQMGGVPCIRGLRIPVVAMVADDLSVTASSLLADDVYWQLSPPATGTWLTPSNWSTLSLPTSADRAFINNDGTASIISGGVDVLDIILGNALSGTLSQSGGTGAGMGTNAGTSSEAGTSSALFRQRTL